MNDLLTPARSTDRAERITLARAALTDTRISPLDRLSLRLGMWLLLRGTRRLAAAPRHADVERIRASAAARAEYERTAAHAQLHRSWRA